MSADASDIADTLAELQYRRRFYIKRLNMTENALRAVTRRALGWQWDMTEQERERLNNQAARIVDALMNGKTLRANDREVADVVSGDVEVMRQAREPMVKARHEIEKQMRREVRKLPVCSWAQGVRGLGELALAVIVAEAGDIGRYPNPGKLKRRLGLAPYKGHAPSTWRRETWRERSLTADEWTELGYDATRLGELYGVVMEPMVKSQGAYKALYDAEKARFAPKAQKPMHAHRHALRVMTQELVINLWRVWHGYEPRTTKLPAQPDGGGQRTCDTHWPPAAAEPVAA